jgi:hypothetical protein
MPKARKPNMDKPPGRPSSYTPEMGQEIADAIASSELGLIHLVNANPHWPDRATIFTWTRKQPHFHDLYYKAKEEQTETIVEYMQEVMAEPHKIVDEVTGKIKTDVPMLRLKMDTMKWHVAKLKPKKFGEMKTEEVANSDLHEDTMKRKAELDERNRKDH